MTTDIVYSQDIQQLETRCHMSWLPQEKPTIEEKETVQDYQRRKTALLGKYNTHIKDIDTALTLTLDLAADAGINRTHTTVQGGLLLT